MLIQALLYFNGNTIVYLKCATECYHIVVRCLLDITIEFVNLLLSHHIRAVHFYSHFNFKRNRAAAFAEWLPYDWRLRPFRTLVVRNVIAATHTMEGPAGVSST